VAPSSSNTLLLTFTVPGTSVSLSSICSHNATGQPVSLV
jgi:hypothetical protein